MNQPLRILIVDDDADLIPPDVELPPKNGLTLSLEMKKMIVSKINAAGAFFSDCERVAD